MKLGNYALAFSLSACALFGQPKLKPGFDVNAIDKSVEPCDNFFQYACGNWLKANPIPSDQTAWNRFVELNERNRSLLKDLLETSVAKKTRTPVEQKIGDYYHACMDEGAREKRGLSPLKPIFSEIEAIKDKKAITDEVAKMHAKGVRSFFRVGSGEDFKDASQVIAQLDQGGLSLPDRDYYLKDDPKSVDTRAKYVAFLEKLFGLLGDPEDKAKQRAGAVMKIETALAKVSLDRVSRRDPAKNYHKLTEQDAAALIPAFDLTRYLAEVGLPPVKTLNVAVPDFFKGLNDVIQNTSLDDLKTYMEYKYVSTIETDLSKPVEDAYFDFFEHTLQGRKEQQARWKRCIAAVDSDLGEALGQKYVEATFGKAGKEHTLRMVHEIEQAMQRDINDIKWMTPETKKKAFEKLHAVANKIGYPEKWKDYSSLTIDKNDPIGNSLRANEFERRRQFAKIGKPVDKKEWFMSPPTVNAYYNPLQNNINFPAGILQPPFFEANLDDAVNYGAIGAVVGHELTHGFDDQGRQFDAEGNLKDWWTEKDAEEFKKRTDCIGSQYSNFKVGDLNVNGKLTMGENVADNGGLRLAYMAMMDSLSKRTQPQGKVDGYTPQQRFFLGFAQVWCGSYTPESARVRVLTDSHSPGQYRVNGTVSNMPEFWQAFGCKAGSSMNRGDKACRVW